jgi:hypothetical protein
MSALKALWKTSEQRYAQISGLKCLACISLLGDPHPHRFHELLRRVVNAVPLATFGLVNIEQPMANTLLRRRREGHFILYRFPVAGKL